MATTAGNLLDRLREKLNDAGAVRWPDAEHFRAMNDAQQAILEARPDLFETLAYMDTVAGVAQTVPADCFRLFDIISNCDSTNAPVAGITKIDRATLDRHRRDWVMLTANSVSQHWMQDKRQWDKFFLCPAQPATNRGKLHIRYAKRPTSITSSSSTLSVPDEAINAVYNFCMHRALEKDEKFAGSPVAAAYYGKFAQFLGAKAQSDAEFEQARAGSEDS